MVKVQSIFDEVATYIFHNLFDLAHKYQSQQADFVCDEYKEKSIKNTETKDTESWTVS